VGGEVADGGVVDDADVGCFVGQYAAAAAVGDDVAGDEQGFAVAVGGGDLVQGDGVAVGDDVEPAGGVGDQAGLPRKFRTCILGG